MKLSIGYLTSRTRHHIEWMIDSLFRQKQPDDEIEVILIDGISEHSFNADFTRYRHVIAKPNVWGGKHRLTKDNWWSKSNSANTFLCLAKHPFIAFLDDRCVLMPGWLNSVKEAIAGNYIMAGAYAKRHNLVVENGGITDFGTLQAEDARVKSTRGQPIPCPGEWLFGCNLAMPLEWLLDVNGYPEKADGMSFEDCLLGLVLQNNKFPMKFDPRAMMIEDRTPDQLGATMKRTAKEKHPHDVNDKAHTLLRWARTAKRCENPFEIRELREKIQKGESFPIPNDSEAKDWFDGQLVRDF